jgi:hypothetical protein
VGEAKDVRQDVPGKFGKRTQAMREEAMGGRSCGTHVRAVYHGSQFDSGKLVTVRGSWNLFR